jgi:hypothetical protein
VNNLILYFDFVNFLQNSESTGLIPVNFLLVIECVEVFELLCGNHSSDLILVDVPPLVLFEFEVQKEGLVFDVPDELVFDPAVANPTELSVGDILVLSLLRQLGPTDVFHSEDCRVLQTLLNCCHF